MPEGDYVRRVASRLDQALAGRTLTYCVLRWPTLGGVDLTGLDVLSVWAYGKHLLMPLSDGSTLRTHLRMDGDYYIERAVDGRPSRDSRAHRWTSRAVLANEAWVVIGQKLGMADRIRTRDIRRLFAHLGPDVMADDFVAEEAGLRITAQGERTIGAVLLDQTVVAGIGTIFLAEGLWAWKVHPTRPARDVPDPAGLLAYIRSILWRSATSRQIGATGDPRPGHETEAHGREHLPCRRCATPIAVIRVGAPPYDRPAFHCPTCQSR
ncbi:MAG: Fpg/Nei family DNA glycosylase [Micrococcales bacterium]|nr:Fpg/Nei family DNA glycosylase [Micrococcales bacterium]